MGARHLAIIIAAAEFLATTEAPIDRALVRWCGGARG